MITYDGVRREAECRRKMEGRYKKIRDLTTADFVSYETLEAVTGVDFKKSDDLALEMGCSEQDLVKALFV